MFYLDTTSAILLTWQCLWGEIREGFIRWERSFIPWNPTGTVTKFSILVTVQSNCALRPNQLATPFNFLTMESFGTWWCRSHLILVNKINRSQNAPRRVRWVYNINQECELHIYRSYSSLLHACLCKVTNIIYGVSGCLLFSYH